MKSDTFRLGEVYDKDFTPDPEMKWMANMPAWLWPKKWRLLGQLAKVLDEQVNYGKPNSFKSIPDASKIYNGLSLTVSPKARGQGLGKEMIRQTMAMAKELQCSHVYILATSIYSQNIFNSIGFEIISNVPYADILDRDGTSPLLKDTREHKNVQIVTYNLADEVTTTAVSPL